MRRNEREVSDNRVIEEIIRKTDVCRIALANDNIPYIVTMNFGYTALPEPRLYFHCANKGRKLEMIIKNSYVCFEMDTDHQIYTGFKGCDWGMKYSSVIGYGNISIVTDAEAKKTGLNCIMKHYGGDKEYSYDEKVYKRTTILRLDIEEMTGKKC
ncbi:MAG: pyridoxamine 5'-phosphate oxidase family protein [Bacteroidetes bacterium]|nr:MAG: pyridoxamine 5'-phosphate oxidase family protein [Bacteroidota bacterium]